MKSAVSSERFVRALKHLDPFQREVISSLLKGEEECADDALAERYGTTLRAVRVARILARKRLGELLSS